MSKNLNTLTAGTQGSIGAFTSLSNTQFSNFPNGTTNNYLENGSSAILNLPVGSSILYAELVWGGLYKSQTQDITNLLNNSINLSVNSNDYIIAPNGTTSQNFLIPSGGFQFGFYVRSAVVTDIVSANLNGTYSAKAIPSILTAISSQTSLSITKSVDKTYAIAGDNLHYTSLIKNKGSQKIENMIFKDVLQSGITFVDGSVKIDGVSYPLYNPIAGFALDDIDAGGTRNVEFDVTVN